AGRLPVPALADEGGARVVLEGGGGVEGVLGPPDQVAAERPGVLVVGADEGAGGPVDDAGDGEADAAQGARHAGLGAEPRGGVARRVEVGGGPRHRELGGGELPGTVEEAELDARPPE